MVGRWFWHVPGTHVCCCRPAACTATQVNKNVEREILNHKRLSGHTNIVQFKEVGSGAALPSFVVLPALRRTTHPPHPTPLHLHRSS